jgi:signal transduction histidine kinase
MSHELRTPLNAVIGFSEVLLERLFGELNDRQDEYLRDILSSGKHLFALLNEILDRRRLKPVEWSLRSPQSRCRRRSSMRSQWCASGRPGTG